MNLLIPRRQRFMAACFLCLSVFASLVVSQSALAQSFPALTGRIVDQANLLSAEQNAQLDSALTAHETATSNQVVVVTVNSLEGYDIADYALRLGREWGIGTADKNNGVVLLVAPNERKVRIEVGYGLEGALPDGLASTIIRSNILPSFKAGDYPAGISNGVTSIIQAIEGEYTAPANATNGERPATTLEKFFPLFFIAFIALSQGLQRFASKRVANAAFPASFAGLILTIASSKVLLGIGASAVIFILLYWMNKGTTGGNGDGRGPYITRGGGGFGGGGFGGGGGSFGGGGSSGSW